LQQNKILFTVCPDGEKYKPKQNVICRKISPKKIKYDNVSTAKVSVPCYTGSKQAVVETTAVTKR
jgi:hypothetical protein